MIPHRTTEHRLSFLSTHGGLRHGTHNRALGLVPISHAIGFYCVYFATLAYSGTYYMMSAFNPGGRGRPGREAPDHLFVRRSDAYQAMVSAPGYQAGANGSLELVMFGGAPIQPQLLERLGAGMAGDPAPYLRHDRNHVAAAHPGAARAEP